MKRYDNTEWGLREDPEGKYVLIDDVRTFLRAFNSKLMTHYEVQIKGPLGSWTSFHHKFMSLDGAKGQKKAFETLDQTLEYRINKIAAFVEEITE